MLARIPEVPLPPIMAWNTFLPMLDLFKDYGVPDTVTHQTLSSVTPELRSRILTGLRALKLIDQDGRTQAALRTLVSARGTGQWQVQLRVLMNIAYPYLAALNLAEAESADVSKAFARHIKRETANLSKCEAFYLNLARSAGVNLSDSLKKRVATSDAMAAIRRLRKAIAMKSAAKVPEPT